MFQIVSKGARYKWAGKGGAKKAEAAPTGKGPRFYPADDVPVPRKSGRHVQKVRKNGGEWMVDRCSFHGL